MENTKWVSLKSLRIVTLGIKKGAVLLGGRVWSNIICWQIFLELFISLFSTRFLHSLTWGCLVASWEGIKKGLASPLAHSVSTALSPFYSAVNSEVFLISSLLRITSALQLYPGCRYGSGYADMQSGCRYVGCLALASTPPPSHTFLLHFYCFISFSNKCT